MTPLERASRALYLAIKGPFSDQLAQTVDQSWPSCVHEVRAVLEAIREPSDAMERHAEYLNELNDGVARFAWQAMIDAALAEGPSS